MSMKYPIIFNKMGRKSQKISLWHYYFMGTKKLYKAVPNMLQSETLVPFVKAHAVKLK